MIIWTNEHVDLIAWYEDIVIPDDSSIFLIAGAGTRIKQVDEDYALEVLNWSEALIATVDVIYYAALNSLVINKPAVERDTWELKRSLAEQVLQGDTYAIEIVNKWAVPLNMTAEQFAKDVILAKARKYQTFVARAEELRQKGKALISKGIPVGKEIEYLQLLNSYLHTFLTDIQR